MYIVHIPTAYLRLILADENVKTVNGSVFSSKESNVFFAPMEGNLAEGSATFRMRRTKICQCQNINNWRAKHLSFCHIYRIKQGTPPTADLKMATASVTPEILKVWAAQDINVGRYRTRVIVYCTQYLINLLQKKSYSRKGRSSVAALVGFRSTVFGTMANK